MSMVSAHGPESLSVSDRHMMVSSKSIFGPPTRILISDYCFDIVREGRERAFKITTGARVTIGKEVHTHLKE